jgi:hypothetical protein
LHHDDRMGQAQRQVRAMIRDLISAAADTGDVRSDVPPEELANYCVHALSGASTQRSKAAIDRLVSVTLDGLAPR